MNRKEFFGTLGASAVAASALKAAVPASTATPVSAAIPNLARLLCLDDVEAERLQAELAGAVKS